MPRRKYTTLSFTEYVTASGHYDTTRSPITKIVLHSSASTRQGLIDTFGGGTRLVSAHYGIDNDGSILAFLEEYNTAYHAGVYEVNQTSIGIEHIDNGATVKLHTDAQYETSIKLVADICKFYSIPVDSLHIIPHSAVKATACPNGLDVNRIIEGVKALHGEELVVVNDQTKLDLSPCGTGYGLTEFQQVKAMIIAKDAGISHLNDKIKELTNIPPIIASPYGNMNIPTPNPIDRLWGWFLSKIGR